MLFVEFDDVVHAPNWGILEVFEILIDDFPVLGAFKLSTQKTLQP